MFGKASYVVTGNQKRWNILSFETRCAAVSLPTKSREIARRRVSKRRNKNKESPCINNAIIYTCNYTMTRTTRIFYNTIHNVRRCIPVNSRFPRSPRTDYPSRNSRRGALDRRERGFCPPVNEAALHCARGSPRPISRNAST